jgi:UV excision repair protein RAD23
VTNPTQTSHQSHPPAPQGGQQQASLNPQHPPQQPQEQLDPNNEIVQNMQHKEETIQELMLMGFDRPEVEKALAAAFYYKERAIEYLISVI